MPPSTGIELKLHHGRPTVFENGTIVPMAAYDNSILRTDGDWQKRVQGFIDSGVKVFHLRPWNYKWVYGQTEFWTDEDVYPVHQPPKPGEAEEGLTLAKQAAFILQQVPDARFFVRLGSYAPKPWAAKNPGELQIDEHGKTYEPSWASQKYLNGMRGYFRNVIGYVESESWGPRVLGYFIVPYGEGLTILAGSGNFFDCSAAMQRAWHLWLQHKYGTEEALRAAWGDPTATLQDAALPKDSELRQKIGRSLHWPEPAALARERDYCYLQREIFAHYFDHLVESVHGSAQRNVLIGFDCMKQPLLGWQLGEAFGTIGGVDQAAAPRGTDAFSMFLASGSFGVGDLLDHPLLSGLVTPGDYTARGVGLPFEAEGIGDSLVLRGKALFIENDSRTWLAQETPDLGPPLGSFMTLPETRAGLERNTALTVSRGFFHYWEDINYRTGYFQTPQLQREITRDKEILLRGSAWPHRETEHAIAMIIDDESPLHENFTTGFQQLALLRQRIEGLGLAGIPYRIYLLSDLEKANFPAYRCYLFPNLFKVNDEVIALLKQKVLRDGRLAIFGPGTGVTDGNALSAAGAEKLLGIPMKLHAQSSSRRVRLNRGAHPAVTDAQLPPLFGDSFDYGPILAPDRPGLDAAGAVVLGESVTAFGINAPGLVLREAGAGAAGNGKAGDRGAGDYATVFTMAVPLPAALLRSLARYAGCNVWCDRDAVVSASDTMVSLHSNEPGPFTVTLPRRARNLYDAATGKVHAQDVLQWRQSLSPPATRTYLFD